MFLRAEPEQQRVIPVERTAEREPECTRVVVADRCLQTPVALGRRLGAAHIDQAAQRIGAVPAALRTTQDFHRPDVEQGRHGADATEVDIIDDEADRRVRRALVLLELTHAANLEIASPVTVAGPAQVRHDVDEFLEVLHRRRLDECRIEDADAGRQLGDGALAKVRRDDDLVDGVFGNDGAR